MIDKASIIAVTHDPIDRLDLSEQVYSRLRQKIFVRELPPGARLDLDLIARALRVSRTPINNALIRLTEEGLARTEHRRGTFITELTAQDVTERYDIRQALELLAAEKGIGFDTEGELRDARQILENLSLFATSTGEDYLEYLRVNQQFHLKFIEFAHNRKLLEIYKSLHTDVINARLFYHGRTRAWSEVDAEHHVLFKAYEAKDLEAARSVIRAHCENAKSVSIRLIEEKGGVV